MNVIYEPRGAAREYSPLAVNLYSGCSHGCTYCYVPGCLRRTREQFAKVSPREGVLKALEKDARGMRGDERPILLSFTSDPYQELERNARLTRKALEIMLGQELRVRLLTKNPAMALELDASLIKDGKVEFGTTILFVDDAKRAVWEPGAPTIESRMEALEAAREMGLKTWVSLEPVIDPAEALCVIDRLANCVDVWKVGRWNHDARANATDWASFTRSALELLTRIGARYYIKDELWRSAGAAIAGYAKSVL
jgi:DNA repair photolyase